MGNEEIKIPKKYLDYVGTEKMLGGGLFSGKKAIPHTKYNILDIRWGTAMIVNFTQMKETGESDYEYPTFELLVKNETMKKSRWTRPFSIPEINLKNGK